MRGAGGFELIPLPTIFDTVLAVADGTVERALVPIENSLEGSVSATLDALAIETDQVTIVAESVHPIQQCLIARDQMELEDIEVVVSHPQANGQCSRFIRTRLAGARVMTSSSTADAVRLVSEHGERWAALGPRLAAELYDCQVLRAGVEDLAGNETRFVWLGPLGARPGVPGEAAAARALEDRDRVLGARCRGARVACVVLVGAGGPRRQPDPDRIATAQAGPGSLHVLRRSRRPRPGRARGGGAGRAERARGGAPKPRLVPVCRLTPPAHVAISARRPVTISGSMGAVEIPAPLWSAPPPEHQRRGPEVGRVLV